MVKKQMLVLVIAVTFLIPFAWANDQQPPWCDTSLAGEDVVGECVMMYDARYYHKTTEYADVMRQVGGWKLAVNFPNCAESSECDHTVEFLNSYTNDVITTTPNSCYNFLGTDECQATVFLGHNSDSEGTWNYFIDGHLIGSFEADMGIPKLPVIQLWWMWVNERSGDISVVFRVPFDVDPTVSNVRLRVLENDDFIEQWKFFPPYNRRGVVRTIVPAMYAGLEARFEYRIHGARTVLWFKLPSLEK